MNYLEEPSVVYHLHKPVGRSTVWANRKQNLIITLHAQTGFIQKPLENDLLITIRFLAYFLSDGNQKLCI